jgi:hypothetical protein
MSTPPVISPLLKKPQHQKYRKNVCEEKIEKMYMRV